MSQVVGWAEEAGVAFYMTEVRVADWSLTVAWYVDVLGFGIEVLDLDHKFALLIAGGARLALRQGAASEGAPSGVRLHFVVRDLSAAHARLVGLGIVVTEPADHPREPYREVRLHDPAGTPITLFAWRSPS